MPDQIQGHRTIGAASLMEGYFPSDSRPGPPGDALRVEKPSRSITAVVGLSVWQEGPDGQAILPEGLAPSEVHSAVALDQFSSPVNPRDHSPARLIINQILIILTMSACTLALLAGIAHSRFGSLQAASAYLNGAQLFASDPWKHIGTLTADQPCSITYQITNLRNSPVTILGSRVSCSCTVVDSLPPTLNGMETFELRIRVTPKSSTTHVNGFITLYTNLQSQPMIQLGFEGIVGSKGVPDRLASQLLGRPAAP